MNENYLLKTDGAVRLYREYAKELPIIDYHNHLSVKDLAKDRQYEDIYELWLGSDPYKHRLMRIAGVPEEYITGARSPREKFRQFCRIFPYTAGNPVYDWARMELSGIFGIDELPSFENADYLFDRLREMLRSPELSAQGILSRFGVEYHAPVASLTDDLSNYDGIRCAPSLRADELLSPNEDLKKRLEAATRVKINSDDDYIRAVSVMLESFKSRGCRFADHALDADFFEGDFEGRARMLTRLASEYARYGFTMLLHIGAKRKTSKRLAALAGPTGGYAAVGGNFNISAICDLLNDMEEGGGLPDTVLFPLNMNDQAPLAVMQGSFSEDGTPSKVQLGPAWWWCDHALGIENTLNCISSFGVVSQFIGMTTDSRSILSFVRHDYFRRILCSWIDRQNTAMDMDIPFEVQGEIIRKICYENAKKKLKI